jgi:hypothetical protein
MKVGDEENNSGVADGDAGGDAPHPPEPRLPTVDHDGDSSDGEDWSEYESELSDSDDAFTNTLLQGDAVPRLPLLLVGL